MNRDRANEPNEEDRKKKFKKPRTAPNKMKFTAGRRPNLQVVQSTDKNFLPKTIKACITKLAFLKTINAYGFCFH